MTDTKKRTGANSKLTKVLSTKVSTEYYNALQTIKNDVYQKRGIDQPTESELLRWIIVNFVDDVRNKQGLSALRNIGGSDAKPR
ncbi:hypothetical protein BH18THE2_BH18THE2_12370 [soil metagenome]